MKKTMMPMAKKMINKAVKKSEMKDKKSDMAMMKKTNK